LVGWIKKVEISGGGVGWCGEGEGRTGDLNERRHLEEQGIDKKK
jgi:hypothetical protein